MAEDVIICRELVVRDKADKERIRLSCDDDGGAYITLLSSERPVLVLSCEPNGRTTISFFSESGSGILGVGTDEKGSPGISIIDPSNKKVCLMTVDGVIKVPRQDN